MSGNLVKESIKTTAGKARVSYGLILTVGTQNLNEWGLSETEAKSVDRILTMRNDEPFTNKNGIKFSRRPVSDFAAELAELETQLKPVTV